MYDLCNKVYLDACIQPGRNKNEFKALTDMVDGSALKDKNVIVIADRGYESYNVFAHIEEKGWKYIIRVKDAKSKGIVFSLDLPKIGEFDCQLTRYKSSIAYVGALKLPFGNLSIQLVLLICIQKKWSALCKRSSQEWSCITSAKSSLYM